VLGLGPAAARLGPVVTVFGHSLVTSLTRGSPIVVIEQPAPSCICTCGASEATDKVVGGDIPIHLLLWVFTIGIGLGLASGVAGATLLFRRSPPAVWADARGPRKGSPRPKSGKSAPPGPLTPASLRAHGRSGLPDARRRRATGAHYFPEDEAGLFFHHRILVQATGAPGIWVAATLDYDMETRGLNDTLLAALGRDAPLPRPRWNDSYCFGHDIPAESYLA